MIGKITGTFCGYYNNVAMIDVYFDNSSIGYEILMKNNDILTLKVGDIITVYIKEIIKEDDDSLYGFLSFEEKCWFEELIKLSGLGPKSALAILSTYSCKDISCAITTNDCNFFESVSGIGGKMANRIPKEMIKNIENINGKILNFMDIKSKNNFKKNDINKNVKYYDHQEDDNKSTKENNTLSKKIDINDAINTLIALGFSKQEIYKEIYDIVNSLDSTSTEDIVKKFMQKKDH